MDYFITGPDKEADMAMSAKTMQELHYKYSDVFIGIGCFKDTFPLQVKEGVNPYQVPPRPLSYMLQVPFKKKLGRLQEQQIMAPTGIDETAEWCNNFFIVPKSNGTVCLCLDPAWLKKALKRPIHKGPIFSVILSKLTNAC